MAAPKSPKIQMQSDGTNLLAEIAAREEAVRDRAFDIAKARSAPVDPSIDWLEAERSLYRRAPLRMSLTKNSYSIAIELPGIAAKDVSIRAGCGRLTVTAARGAANGTPLIDELGAAETWRDVTLPPDADTTTLAASLLDGILTLALTRKAPPVEAPPERAATVPAPLGEAVAKRPAKRAPARTPVREPAKSQSGKRNDKHNRQKSAE